MESATFRNTQQTDLDECAVVGCNLCCDHINYFGVAHQRAARRSYGTATRKSTAPF